MTTRVPNRPALLPPPGLRVVPDFLAAAEEAALLAFLRALPFDEVEMNGQIGKRQVRHFGWVYGYDAWSLTAGPALPDALAPLRAKAAALIGRAPEELAETLVTRYPPGAGIGWHRDAPMFGPEVVGVSLASEAVMAFRLPRPGERLVWKQPLAPRAAYVIGGEARKAWQHTIAKCPEERYSITFRTLISRA